jgi:hypothetical protein
MCARFITSVLSIVVSAPLVHAGEVQAPRDAMLPRAEIEAWANRVRKLTREGWTVTIRGNDVIVQREKPVRFAQASINAPAATSAQPPDLRVGPYRFTLRFAPKMTVDDYERRAATNAASEKERERLQEQARLPHKFGEFLATTPDEKARLRAYRAAEARLTWHELPDLYTPDHSICLYQSWDTWSWVHDKDVAAECREIRESVLRYFGMYDPAAAAGTVDAGSPETRAER